VGDWSGTVPTYAAGDEVKASNMQIESAIETALTGAWTDWSASLTITASPTPPTKGDSTYSARYARLSKLVIFQFKVTIGSTFVAGSGTYIFGIPYPAHAADEQVGAAYMLDSGTANRIGVCAIVGTGGLSVFRDGLATALSDTGPGTAWAAGDQVRCSIIYEAA
jgi:hypothetical protein